MTFDTARTTDGSARIGPKSASAALAAESVGVCRLKTVRIEAKFREGSSDPAINRVMFVAGKPGPRVSVRFRVE